MKYYFIFIAVIGGVSGLSLLVARIGLLLNGNIISGTVEEKQNRKWILADGDSTYKLLVIAYVDKNGIKQSFIEQNPISSYFYNVGDSIILLQDPKNPERIMARGYAILFLAPLIILLMSAVAGYVGFK